MSLADHGGKLGCLAMIITACLTVLVIIGYNSNKSAVPSGGAGVAPAVDTGKHVEIDHGSEFGAWSICQKFVEDKLLAPKTAEFADFDQSKVHDLGSGDFEVISYVDAQNKFGAQIRQRYLCKVHYAGDRNWNLKGLTFKP